ncbi:GSCOCG00002731001-RA-CDS [Cotesia congregata]|nr:GSCOCG00002731001-RA-CDS [Cotesia congregata]
MTVDNKLGEHKLNYEWQIDDFLSVIQRPSFTANKDGFLQSPTFSVEGTSKNLWYLRLRMLEENSSNKEWLSLSLTTLNKETEATRASCVLFILNNKQKKKFAQIFCNSFVSSHIDWCCEKFIDKNLLIDKKDEFLPNNMLSIGIELTIFDGPINSVDELASISNRTIIGDLKKLLNHKEGSDITLLVGDQEFNVHKAILVSRSPVFCKWLLNSPKEHMVEENKLILTNFDVQTCRMMLEFIYTDKVENLESNIENLLGASDFYQLKGLKEICEEHLCESIIIENVARIMVLAYRHSAKQLFDYAIDFGAINIQQVMKTRYYVDVTQFYPLISTMLLEKLANIIAAPSTPQSPEVMKFFSNEQRL